jgi:hypothetical protein
VSHVPSNRPEDAEMPSQASSQRGHYPPDSILQVVHLVALPGPSDRKSLKLLNLEFANSIEPSGFLS